MSSASYREKYKRAVISQFFTRFQARELIRSEIPKREQASKLQHESSWSRTRSRSEQQADRVVISEWQKEDSEVSIRSIGSRTSECPEISFVPSPRNVTRNITFCFA